VCRIIADEKGHFLMERSRDTPAALRRRNNLLFTTAAILAAMHLFGPTIRTTRYAHSI